MRGIVHVLVLLLVAPTLAFVSAGEPPAAPCPVVDVPIVGAACIVPGGFLMAGADGVLRFTHGPDPIPVAPPLVAPSGGTVLEGVDPECVTDLGRPAIRVIVARANAAADRSATLVPLAREAVRNANAIVLAEALKFGEDIRLKIRCDAAGEIDVHVAELATPPSATTFSSVDRDLRALGYGDSLNKEWVVLDGAWPACNCGGWSQLMIDDSPWPWNANNQGGLFSVTFVRNYGTAEQMISLFEEVMLHEIGHNLGAVMLSSPNTSGGFHCTDGGDVMCYADSPNSRYRSDVCTSPLAPTLSRVFDCNNDDYFHPSPADGSYLATHWNLASGASHFLARVPARLP